MTDDDLTRDLEAWAAATDPVADPITPTDVATADADGVAIAAPRRARPWLAVAAAVVVVLALGAAAVVATQRDEDGSVTAEDGTSVPSTVPDGSGEDMPLQVVLVNDAGPDMVLTFRPLTCPEGEDCQREIPPAIDPGTTSLVLDTTLDHPLAGRVLATRCTDAACPERTLAPGQAGMCTIGMIPVDRPTRLVLTVAPEGDGIGCSTEVVDTFPFLDVPPDFSLRQPSLVDCGVGAVDAGQPAGPSDPDVARAAFDCLTGSIGDDETVELVTSEALSDDTVVRSWWRVLPEPVDGRRIEVFRDPGPTVDGWTRTRCATFSTGEGGDPVGPTLEGCAEDETIYYAPPALGGDAGSAPTTTIPPSTAVRVPPAPGTVDVVLDVDGLRVGPDEGIARRWSISAVDTEVASGHLTEIGGPPGFRGPDVQLVGNDIPSAAGEALGVTVEDYDCSDATACRTDSYGPAPGATPVDSCTAEAPDDRTGPVLLVTLRGNVCEAEWVAAVPALTVPPAWSTRPTSDRCGDATWDTSQACLQDALDAGETAEWTDNGDGARITFLVDAGAVQIFWRINTDPARWTIEHGCNLDQTDCDPEEPLSLDP